MLYVRSVLIYLSCLLLPYHATAADNILPASQVFIPRVTQTTDNRITIAIDIKSGYYLYRERLFAVTIPNQAISVDKVTLSPGINKTDPFFGRQSIWYGGKTPATIQIHYQNPNALTAVDIQLKYQGCQDGVICYPPEKATLAVQLPVNQATNDASSSAIDRLFATSSVNTAASTAAGTAASTAAGTAANKTSSAASSAIATPSDSGLAIANKTEKPLPPEQAFPFTVDSVDATTVTLRWHLPDGYYLYRDKINITGANVAKVSLTEGESYHDEFYGQQRIYRGNTAEARIYLHQGKQTELAVAFQGCQEGVICYPIIKHRIPVNKGATAAAHTDNTVVNYDDNNSKIPEAASSAGGIAHLSNTLKSNLWLGVGLLLLAGMALAFTPCVLPMLPILLSIITNQRQVSKTRAAILSSSYALGVAVMMAVFGLLVAKTGINIQIILQKPLWLVIFAGIFIVMGLAMLGLFTIAMPNTVQSRIIGWQNKFQHANPFNLFIVGALSTLIVGPCIAPPLIAILTFIATTNDSLLGALYLFFLGLGMSLPLVIFATLVTSIPKTGAFSRLITRIFAMLMFGVGLWLLSRLLPGAVSLLMWGLFMLAVAVIFWQSHFIKTSAKQLSRAIAVVCVVLGLAWIAGGTMGNSNPLKPFTRQIHLPFQQIDTLSAFKRVIDEAQKPVMLDLYADWCVSCQELEYITFADDAVVDALDDFILLKVDISETTKAHNQLLAQLELIGPPALLFFVNGQEIKEHRQIGVIGVKPLLQKLKRVKSLKK